MMPVEVPGMDVAPAAQPISTPFPARVKQASTNVNGTRTDAMAMSFTDKLLLTISQEGKLGHWVHVPLDITDSTASDRRQRAPAEDGSDLFPLSSLTATTILGGGIPERDTFGQLIATQIATAVVTRNPEERRLLVIGMGLAKAQVDGDSFAELVGLAVSCL